LDSADDGLEEAEDQTLPKLRSVVEFRFAYQSEVYLVVAPAEQALTMQPCPTREVVVDPRES
jgi:hypothetical protein